MAECGLCYGRAPESNVLSTNNEPVCYVCSGCLTGGVEAIRERLREQAGKARNWAEVLERAVEQELAWPEDQRQTGRVKHVFGDKGFGFIWLDNRGGQLFFHVSGLVSGLALADLRRGDRVSLTIGSGRDGRPRAVAVDLIERAGDTA